MLRRIDLTNKTIANIYVINEAPPRKDHRGYPIRMWNCKCLLCNKNFVAIQHELLSGNTKSCGCSKSKSLIGCWFGDLLVIGEDFSKIDNRGHRIKRWICLCICGSITCVTTTKLKNGHTQSCGCSNSRGEKIIAKFLSILQANFKRQYMFNDLLGPKGYCLRFDFAIFDKDNKELLYLIEYQGIQHKKPCGPNGYGLEQREITDRMKKEYCKKNNIKLYEIWYDQDILTELHNIITYENSVLNKQNNA